MPTRHIISNKHDNKAVLLNYQENLVKEIIDPNTIKNTIPDKALKEFQKDDPEPYYKVQKIEYPITANGINYHESFFKSFISKLKDRPIPGSKSGHSIFWGERPNTDFIMVGGKIESKGNGKGFVYFKNYIPPSGAETSNETFIRENKADMVHFSLVTYPKYEIETEDDGSEIINAVESLRGERNDAVEWGMGAMGQETNQKDHNDQEIDLIDNKEGGENNLNKEELLKVLNTMKANADITLIEVAEAMGLKNQVITDEHIEAVKIVNSLKELGMKDPVKDYEKLKNKISADKESVRNARLDKEYGPEKDPVTNKENLLRTYAGQKAAGLDGEELENAIKDLKDDPIAKRFAAERADYNSEANTIGVVEKGNNDPAKFNSQKVVKI